MNEPQKQPSITARFLDGPLQGKEWKLDTFRSHLRVPFDKPQNLMPDSEEYLHMTQVVTYECVDRDLTSGVCRYLLVEY